MDSKSKLENIIQVYQANLIRHLAHICGNLELAKKLTQDTLVELAKRPDVWSKDFLNSWLFRTGRKLGKQAIEKNAKTVKSVANPHLSRRDFNLEKDDPFDRESFAAFCSAYHKLTTDQQEILQLKVSLELSNSEIGKILAQDKERIQNSVDQSISKIHRLMSANLKHPHLS